MAAFFIRRASADDLYDLAELELRSSMFEQRLAPLPCSVNELYDIWYERYLSGQYEILIALMQNKDELEQKMVGFIAFRAPWRQVGFIHALYVEPDFFRRGIGAHLFRAAEKILSQKCCPSVILHVEPKNIAGQRFYSKLGFINQMKFHKHLYVMSRLIKSSI